MIIKKEKLAEFNVSIAPGIKNFIDDFIEWKCLCCNKNYQQKFDENLKERFFNKYKFSNHNNEKFTISLQKSVYPYEYNDDLEKFNKT